MAHTNNKQIFRKGEVLMREGDKGDCAYIIERGNVEVMVRKEGQLLQIGTRGPGAIIGEMAMIDERPRTATIRALDECTVLRISHEDFARHVEDADPVLKMVIRVILTRYRDIIARTEGYGFQTSSLLYSAATAENEEKNDSSLNAALNVIKIDSELKLAVERNELLLYYQPIIDLQHMKIAGFEALMRWKHPVKGMISPGIFIPVAEESGLIVELSKWALGVSCDTVKDLQAAANPDILTEKPLFLSVNFSVKDFSGGDFANQVMSVLKEKGTWPESIHLEITESLLMEAPEKAKAALEECRKKGLSVSIDDFGSGYSSLSYLHFFPIDTLKIDQSFIRSMSTHPASMVLVKSIIGLAKNLGMKIIAEGIETAEEAKIIRDLGCEECQGFFFAKPMPYEEAIKFVQSWKAPAIS